MEQAIFFRSVLDQDTAPIVLCNLDHIIIYMNRAAVERYSHFGGASLIGKSLFLCHNKNSKDLIGKVLNWFSTDKSHNRVLEMYSPDENKDVYIVALRDETGNLIGYYEKHEYRNPEEAGPYDFSD